MEKEKQKEITLSSPLFLTLSDKPNRKTGKITKYPINLNAYRNWQFIINNNLKIRYKELMKDKIESLKSLNIKTPIELEFTLYAKDSRRRDKSNIHCIQEKFFSDALVEFGIIPDDNDEYILRTSYEPSLLDKTNPRVDIKIKWN